MNEPNRAALAGIITEIIEKEAPVVDTDGIFPRAGITALGKAGLLGLMTAQDVGGLGQGIRAAAELVEQVGRACGSTGMVLCMHFTGNTAIEKCGPRAVREAIEFILDAQGKLGVAFAPYLEA